MARMSLWLDGTMRVGEALLSVRDVALFLDAIGEERSIRAAADRLEISYRSAWNRASSLAAAFGRPVMTKTKGHGTRLTPAGEALRAALARARRRLASALAEEASGLERRLQELSGSRPAPCRIAISHDPGLMDLLAGLPEVEVSVVGSQEAVRRLRSGEAELAGFHRPPSQGGRRRRPGILEDAALEVVPLLRREQGLIVARGNPLGIGCVRDLGRAELRFVNRQKGSGTRSWTDLLMAEAGLRPTAVRGYAHEEFTHGAVAAMVASGMADAGMGVRAAAERSGLGFVPLGEELYYLAARRGELPPAGEAILAKLGREGDLVEEVPRPPPRPLSAARPRRRT